MALMWRFRASFAVPMLVAVVAVNGWAMRPHQDAAKRNPGVAGKPAEVFHAIQDAPARYAAWRQRNVSPQGKSRLYRQPNGTVSVTPAAASINTRQVAPDLDVQFDPAIGSASRIQMRTASKQITAGGTLAAGRLLGPLSMGPMSGDGPTGKPQTELVQALHQYRGLLRVNNAFEEFQPQSTVTDEMGLRHEKSQQVYNGVPIWGRQVWVHADAQNAPYLIEGKVQPTPAIDTQPILTDQQAIVIAQQDMPAAAKSSATLLIYVADMNVPRLVWHVVAGSNFQRFHWFVDASTGTIVHRFNDNRYETAAGSGVDLFNKTQTFSAWLQGGTYYLVDTTQPMHAADPLLPNSLGAGNIVLFNANNQDPEGTITGSFIGSASPSSGWNAAAVTVMNHMRTVTQYYKNTHNRNGIDGKTLNSISFVHVGRNYDNAYWSGQAMFFGDGQQFLSLARSLDVLAHEYTHGVIDYTASFAYEFQSGALHEALADVFGCMVDRDDWLMGEDIVRSGPAMRNLKDPHSAMDTSPATMDEYQVLPYSEDLGGVHVNATIVGHAAYLMAEGLSNAIGRAKVEKVFYRALTMHMTSQSNFADCRAATTQSAEELYGAGSPEVEAVTDAWNIVKVGGSGTSGGGGGSSIPATPGPDGIIFLYYSTGGGVYLGIRNGEGDEYKVTSTPVSEVRPVVTTGGTEVLFVDVDNNLRVASLSVQDVYEEAITFDGSVRTIGGSRDGRYFAFTDTTYDNTLYVMDLLNAENNRPFSLSLPSFDGGAATSLLAYADVLDFDITNEHVIFDALSQFGTSTGQAQTFWSVGILDISSGQVSSLVATLPPGVQIGNPCASSTEDWIIAVDVSDENNGTCQTRAINTINGKSGLISEDSPAEMYGWPTFNGDDTAVAVQNQDNVFKVPVTKKKDGSVNGDPSRQELVTERGYYPRYYRIGQNGAAGQLSLSSTTLEFGQVNTRETVSLVLKVANTGSGQLQITGVSRTGDDAFSHDGSAILLQAGYEMDVTVTFSPAAAGAASGVLHITSDDSEASDVTVQLKGEGVRKGCFIATAAYGSYLDPHVASLRTFRDEHLLTNGPGRAFVAGYYRYSPPVAAVIARHESLRTATRWALTPLVLGVQYPTTATVVIVTIAVGSVVWLRRRRRAAALRPM